MKLNQIQSLQFDHAMWLDHNFPDQQEHDALLGLVEEVGELAHAHLKAQQGIRGTLEELQAEARDAIGDIFIYLMSYCNTNHYSLDRCIRDAWDEVKDRDWQKYPDNGMPPPCGTAQGIGGNVQFCILEKDHLGEHEWGPRAMDVIGR